MAYKSKSNLEEGLAPGTVYYLGYASNLSAETFLKMRGIHPISQMNVVVPHLRLTFDLPGIPFQEPCFCNTEMREDPPSHESNGFLFENGQTEKSQVHHSSAMHTEALRRSKSRYRKDRWQKGLVGVVYELTHKDFAHIIETEGGGSAYRDIIVSCYPLLPGSSTVPEYPSTQPVQAHTLFAPAAKPGDPPPKPGKGTRPSRPDPSYAQPSARYLKLITDGAREHELPQEYREYLAQIRPYKPTQMRQKVGAFVFLTIWTPLFFVVRLGPLFADKDGRAPTWFMRFTAALFLAVWQSYDGFFKKIFGDGERTIGTDGEPENLKGLEYHATECAFFRHDEKKDPENLV